MFGMELFAYKVRFDDNDMPIDLDTISPVNIPFTGHSPRENFDNFLNAFTTIFILLIGDVSFLLFTNIRAGTTLCTLMLEPSEWDIPYSSYFLSSLEK